MECAIENGVEVFKLKKRHAYYGQVQLGMAILNIKETDLALYSSQSDTLLKINVPFDEDFAKRLLITVTKYFKNMLHVFCERNKECK